MAKKKAATKKKAAAKRIYVNLRQVLSNVMDAADQAYLKFTNRENIMISKSGLEYTIAKAGAIQARCFQPNEKIGSTAATIYFSLVIGAEYIDLPLVAKARNKDDIALAISLPL